MNQEIRMNAILEERKEYERKLLNLENYVLSNATDDELREVINYIYDNRLKDIHDLA